MNSDRPRVAIMIDGDNMPVRSLLDIETYAQSEGEVVIRRVYGVEPALRGWGEVDGYAKLVSLTGKNVTDFMISMDSVELAALDQIDKLVIVSNDTDFAPLAQKLRRMGVIPLGAGFNTASDHLKKHFRQFKVLEQRTATKECVGYMLDYMRAGGQAAVATSGENRIVGMARMLLDGVQHASGLTLSSFGQLMQATYGIGKSDLSTRNWRSFLLAYPDIFRLEGEDQDTLIFRADAPEQGRLDVSDADSETVAPKPAAPVVAADPFTPSEVMIDRAIRRIITEHGTNDEILASKLALHMREFHGISAKQLPTRKWQKYLALKPDQFEMHEDGSIISVRLISRARATAAA